MLAAPIKDFSIFTAFEHGILAISARLILHLSTPTEQDILPEVIVGVATGSILCITILVIVTLLVVFFCVWRREKRKASNRMSGHFEFEPPNKNDSIRTMPLDKTGNFQIGSSDETDNVQTTSSDQTINVPAAVPSIM